MSLISLLSTVCESKILWQGWINDKEGKKEGKTKKKSLALSHRVDRDQQRGERERKEIE